MSGAMSRLLTMAQVHATSKATPKDELFKQAAEKEKREASVERKEDDTYRREVYKREHGLCQGCGRKCDKTRRDIPERAEAHHLNGRVGFLRTLVRAMALLCRDCHRRATGQVNDRIAPAATVKHFRMKGQRLIEGKALTPASWEKVA